MPLPRTAALLGLLWLAACGDPFLPPACYSGPGCGEDDVPPQGKILEPLPYTTVYGPFWLKVEATDNIGVLAVNYTLMGLPPDQSIDAEPPYQFLVRPNQFDSPTSLPGPRDLTIFIHDVADNVDTLELTVNYQF